MCSYLEFPIDKGLHTTTCNCLAEGKQQLWIQKKGLLGTHEATYIQYQYRICAPCFSQLSPCQKAEKSRFSSSIQWQLHPRFTACLQQKKNPSQHPHPPPKKKPNQRKTPPSNCNLCRNYSLKKIICQQ